MYLGKVINYSVSLSIKGEVTFTVHNKLLSLRLGRQLQDGKKISDAYDDVIHDKTTE